MFMDANFTALGIVERYSSLQWRENYFGVGSFALTVAGSYAAVAKKAVYVIWNESSYTGIIDDFDSDTHTVTLQGSFLEKELLYRAVNRFVNYSGNAEAVMRALVNDFCIQPVDRRIPLLRLGANRNLGGDVSISPMGETVLEVIEHICLEQELSFMLRYDFVGHAIVFEAFQGINRTQGQDANVWCTFSKEFDNVLEERYKLTRDGRNFIYVAGEGEGAERVVLEINLTDGERRRELFVEARDLTRRLEDGGEMPMPEYLELLRTRGKQRAANYVTVESVDINVAPQNTMEYGLGDIVTYTNHELGITAEKRITEINYVTEQNFVGNNVVLGRSSLSIIDKLKRDRSVGR